MLNFKYISSRGNEYDLLTTAAMLTECNAFDYKYKPVTFGKRYGAKIYGFEMDIKTFEATFYIFGDKDFRVDNINELIADFDYDIMTQTPGTFVCNGYSIQGYSPESSESSCNSSFALWDTFKRSFVCPYPLWSKQTFFKLFTTTEEPIEWTDIKDYLPVSPEGKADYEWDYKTYNGNLNHFYNSDLIGSEWKAEINGPAVNPYLRIGENIIEMMITVAENETLIIDSRTKTIILRQADGTEINAYGYRDVSVDIFKKIPRGNVSVYWENIPSWTITTFDERTAPLWN